MADTGRRPQKQLGWHDTLLFFRRGVLYGLGGSMIGLLCVTAWEVAASPARARYVLPSLPVGLLMAAFLGMVTAILTAKVMLVVLSIVRLGPVSGAFVGATMGFLYGSVLTIIEFYGNPESYSHASDIRIASAWLLYFIQPILLSAVYGWLMGRWLRGRLSA